MWTKINGGYLMSYWRNIHFFRRLNNFLEFSRIDVVVSSGNNRSWEVIVQNSKIRDERKHERKAKESLAKTTNFTDSVDKNQNRFTPFFMSHPWKRDDMDNLQAHHVPISTYQYTKNALREGHRRQENHKGQYSGLWKTSTWSLKAKNVLKDGPWNKMSPKSIYT